MLFTRFSDLRMSDYMLHLELHAPDGNMPRQPGPFVANNIGKTSQSQKPKKKNPVSLQDTGEPLQPAVVFWEKRKGWKSGGCTSGSLYSGEAAAVASASA